MPSKYDTCTKVELIRLCESRNVKVSKSMKKQELIDVVKKTRAPKNKKQQKGGTNDGKVTYQACPPQVPKPSCTTPRHSFTTLSSTDTLQIGRSAVIPKLKLTQGATLEGAVVEIAVAKQIVNEISIMVLTKESDNAFFLYYANADGTINVQTVQPLNYEHASRLDNFLNLCASYKWLIFLTKEEMASAVAGSSIPICNA